MIYLPFQGNWLPTQYPPTRPLSKLNLRDVISHLELDPRLEILKEWTPVTEFLGIEYGGVMLALLRNPKK